MGEYPARIDVIKIDTQGSETAALRGLEQSLAASKQARIVLEFWPFGLLQCGSSAAELVGWLSAHRYRLWRIGPDASTQPVSSDDLLALSAGELHPDGQGFTDLVAIAPDDLAGVAAITARQPA
jgi:hypothetical protein